MEALCEESGGKELCLELVDIYQVAYLSPPPLSSLSGSVLWPMHTYIYINLYYSTCHGPWRFDFLVHPISLVDVCTPVLFSKRNKGE